MWRELKVGEMVRASDQYRRPNGEWAPVYLHRIGLPLPEGLTPIRRLEPDPSWMWITWQRLPTYVWEFAAVTLYLTVICVATGVTPISVLTTIAIAFTFQHMQVSSRLQEAQQQTTVTVECHAKLTRYLFLKETFWALVFGLTPNWPALAIVPAFALYPVWRRWYLNFKEYR